MKDFVNFAEDIDSEWAELILTALELGINEEEIRDFLSNSSGQKDKEFQRDTCYV